MTDVAGIGDRIRKLRAKESRDSFAERYNLSKQTVLRYESGTSIPDIGFVVQLCEEYGITPNWLIFGENYERDKKGKIQEATESQQPAEEQKSRKKGIVKTSAKEWALMLDFDYFERLFDMFRKRTPALRGWFQIEIVTRFPEFTEWLDDEAASRRAKDTTPMFIEKHKWPYHDSGSRVVSPETVAEKILELDPAKWETNKP